MQFLNIKPAESLLLFFLALSPILSFSQSKDTTANIMVHGLCSMCKERIETAAKGKGVSDATWDADTKMMRVTFAPKSTNIDKIEKRIVAAGHDAGNKKADDAVYVALPACCHYRESEKMGNTAHTMQGIVMEENQQGVFKALEGASIIWLGSGQGTTTNNEGIFTLPFTDADKYLIISYTGFSPDTVLVNPTESVMVVLAKNGTLQEVKVTARQRSLYTSTTGAFRTQTMNEKELFKAACCNLSESFETNPSVDVSFSDAVTGAKQIQLLGLSGNYTQLTVENLPGPRGLATPMGLQYIPGPWVESIQLTKGTGSVANGFESIAGQINVEMKQPLTSDRLYANGYVNNMGKSDLNLVLTQKVSNKWSTALLLHNNFLYNKIDFNKDGFMDQPIGNLFTAVNRWRYQNTNGWESQMGFKVLTDNKQGGEIDFNPGKDKGTTNSYGLGFNTLRLEGFAKVGYVFPQKKYQSIGLQLSTFQHRTNSYFGLTPYDADQKNVYGNLIYQSIINNTNHKFRTGISFVYDRFKETLKGEAFNRSEAVPGAFFEYTYDFLKKLSVVAGMRVDHNSIYGWFGSPRLNMRYQPFSKTTIRASVGRGQRTANIIAENTSLLVSSRQWQIMNPVAGKAYGLDAEVAWNKGIAIDQKFVLFNREASLGVDYFRNDFVNQIVVDIEDPRSAKFYNLDGKSFSNSLQVELHAEPIYKFEVRLAYRFFDVQNTFGTELLQKPLLARHRGFANLAYETNGWKFDLTGNIIGSKRIPPTTANPEEHRFPGKSPVYALVNAQVSKMLGKKNAIEVYLGGENLGDYLQMDAIVGANDPFGKYFDASLIWGPVQGRMIYVGFRYRIK